MKASPDFLADTIVLMEFSTGNILYDKDGDAAKPPASITKLMTLLLIFEALDAGEVTWDTPVVISERAWRMGGSQMFLEVGQEVSIKDLVTGISVVSANDACVALAEHLRGSETSFVVHMNERAKKIGLKQTDFKNSTGLPAEGHVMSALDIAILSRYLMTKYPEVLEFESQREYTFNHIKQYNRNPLLGSYQGSDGLKTGWTDEAGHCLSGTAQRDGMRLIAVILGTQSEAERLAAAEEVLDYGFLNFTLHEAVAVGEPTGELPVIGGRKKRVAAKAKEAVMVAIKKGMVADLEFKVIETPPRAPVGQGEPLGELLVELDGRVLGRTELVAAEAVKRASIIMRFFRWLLSFVKISPA